METAPSNEFPCSYHAENKVEITIVDNFVCLLLSCTPKVNNEGLSKAIIQT